MNTECEKMYEWKLHDHFDKSLNLYFYNQEHQHTAHRIYTVCVVHKQGMP